MQTIAAIETVFRGYRFRSRLEARWAVFFETLGIDFDYEPEGFDLGETGYYLPDFYLPGLRLWLEIKPQAPSHDEMWKAKTFTELSGENMAILHGRLTMPTMDYFDNIPLNMSTCTYDAMIFYGSLVNVPEWKVFLMGYTSLAEWIRDMGHQADDFDGTIESARALRRKDYEIQAALGNEKLATRHQYGVYSNHNVWVCLDRAYLLSDKGMYGEYGLDRLLPAAYQRAQQARFEHGETP